MAITQERYAETGTYPLNDLTYDLIALLHEKSRGLEELDRFLEDAHGDREAAILLHDMRQREARSIQQLQQHLARRVSLQETGLVGDAC
jgi:hypothetical protein